MLHTMKGLTTLLALCSLFLLSSCGGDGVKVGATNDMASHVPTDASSVVLINLGSMMEKADYDAFSKTEVFEEMLKNVEKDAPTLIPFFKDPKSTGIDLSGNAAIYLRPIQGSSVPQIGVLMPIADAAQFSKALEELKKQESSVKTTDHEGYQLHTFDPALHILQSEGMVAIVSFNDDAALQRLLKPEGNGIRDNEKFAEQIPQGKDISYWINGDKLLENNPRLKQQLNGGASLLGFPAGSLEGNNLYGYQEFGKGKSEGTLDLGLNKDLWAKLQTVFTDPLPVNYANYFPGDDLAAGIVFGLNTSGILAFLTETGFANKIDQNIPEGTNTNLGKIEKGLTGGMAVGVYPSKTAADDPLFVAVIGLKERTFIEGMLAQVPNITKNGEKYIFQGQPDAMTGKPSDLVIYAVVKDDALVISNQTEQLDKALAGNSNGLVKELQNGWLGLYLNYDLLEEGKLTDLLLLAENLPLDVNGIGALMATNDYQNISKAKIMAKGSKITGVSLLKDQSTNVLKSTLMTLNEMYKNGLLDQTEDEFDDFDEAFDEALDAEIADIEKEIEEMEVETNK